MTKALQIRDPKELLLVSTQKGLDQLKSNQTLSATHLPIIITNFGYIAGKIILPNEDSNYPVRFFDEMIDSEFETIAENVGNTVTRPGSITLLKARVYSFDSSKITHFPVLTIFTDQIVGYTYGADETMVE